MHQLKQTSHPIIDFHCDLLGCVEYDREQLDFESSLTNCSIPQLKQGNVKLQTMAIACIGSKGSTRVAERQVGLYEQLLKQYPKTVASVASFHLSSPSIHCIFAIENASGLAEEDEPLERAFERFEKFSQIEKILYVSLTWNGENRFGGGNHTTIGLKEDGKVFLDYLHDTRTAIDLSHTSDKLAFDILNYIEKKELNIVPIASHSNYRAIQPIPRNLPDEIAKDIIKAGGIIGLNFVRRFVGNEERDFIRHIEHGLTLGDQHLCLGADFYGGVEISPSLMPERSFPIFQNKLGDSSCYPYFLTLLKQAFSEALLQKISYGNAQQFLCRQGLL